MAGSMLSFRLCLLLALPTAVLLCRCIPTTSKKLLCEADYVIRGKVTGVVDVLSSDGTNFVVAKLLQVHVQKIYKNTQMYSWTNNCNIEIRTGPSGASCGWIPNNGVYIMAGRINNDVPSISLCNYARTWSTISQDDKDLIRHITSPSTCAVDPVILPLSPRQQRKEARKQQRKEARKQQRKEARKQQRRQSRRQAA